MLDFQQFFGIDLEDLWSGRLSVRRALLLSGGLMDIPDSRYRAERLGSSSFIGWSTTAKALADLFDLNLIIAFGRLGKTPPKDALFDRPKRDVQVVEALTIADFDVDGFTRLIGT